MSKSRKAGRKTRPPKPAAAGRGLPRWAAAALAVAVVAAGAWWWRAGSHADSPGGVVPSARTEAPPPPAPAGQGAPAFPRLKGRWVRVDGGYVVEIRSVESSGKVDAAYFNPRPIHVARAEATQDGEAPKLFIELRDVNYPGSTYSLRYDAGRDVLEGTYFQALEKQTYDVSFVRQ